MMIFSFRLRLMLVSLVSCKVSRFDGLDLGTFAESGNALVLVGLLTCAVVALAGKIRKIEMGEIVLEDGQRIPAGDVVKAEHARRSQRRS